MKLPKKIIIGSAIYDVEHLDVHEAIGRSISGEILYGGGKIRVGPYGDHSNVLNTLVHEILHGVYQEYGLENTEQIVQPAANGLTTIFRDNPKLLKFMIKEAKKMRKDMK